MSANENNDFYDGFMEKYPILFQNKDKPMTETCMCWGIECPPGWKDILTKLCDKLEFLNNTICKEYGLQIVAEQVKEKWGHAVVYYSIHPFLKKKKQEEIYNYIDELVHDLISFAEWKTENVCQVCGKQFFSDEDKIVSKGWIGYYCKECFKKQEYGN